MLELLNLHRPIIANYKQYQVHKDKKLLQENINAYGNIDEHKLRKSMKTANTHDLQRGNEVLFAVAKSYTQFAFATLDKNALVYLQKAEKCYQFVISSIEELPGQSLTVELGNQNSAAEYYKLHIKFDRARLKLMHLLDAKHVEPKEVQRIVDVCTKFREQLKNSYKDKAFQAKISIDTTILLDSVEAEIEKAQQLLVNNQIQTPKRKLIEVSESTQKHEQSKKNEKRRLKKNKPSPSHEKQEEEDGLNTMLLLTEDAPPELRNGLTERATAATSMHSFFPAPTNQGSSSFAQKNTTTVDNLLNPGLALPITPVTNPSTDSKKCNNWVMQWEKENGRSHALEMMGYALLEAAHALQNRSANYRNQKMNPAIQFAVKFLLMSITHTDNPTEEQRELSSSYAELLKPFTVFQIWELAPKYYLEHLRTHSQNDQRLPSFLNLNPPEMMDALFKSLASMCNEQDYQLIIRTCLGSLKTTSYKYSSEDRTHFTL